MLPNYWEGYIESTPIFKQHTNQVSIGVVLGSLSQEFAIIHEVRLCLGIYVVLILGHPSSPWKSTSNFG